MHIAVFLLLIAAFTGTIGLFVYPYLDNPLVAGLYVLFGAIVGLLSTSQGLKRGWIR